MIDCLIDLRMESHQILPPPGSRLGNTCVYLWLPTEGGELSTFDIMGFFWIDIIEASDFDNDQQLFRVDMCESITRPRVIITLNSSSYMLYRVFDDSSDDFLEFSIVFYLRR